MPENLIGSHLATCIRDDRSHDVWRCNCTDYRWRLAKYGEGFCEHLALAIEHTIAVETITSQAKCANQSQPGPNGLAQSSRQGLPE